ncbi:MAG: hypothetical protein HKN14_04690 [Marinicaulis sp.]|nr:hypothetical protein [Marinicaulis sp.]NNE40200.1 hypothetical protein [Marinicaulis sp.]NNL90276.1 hypothetical protein [Marinicaulis sp.]
MMELQYGLWNGASALFSQSGRQLGEANTRPFHLNMNLPAETTTCKYAGNRDGKPINLSALRIAMQNFDAALELTQSIKNLYLHRLPKHESPAPLGLWDLYLFARINIALVAYTKRRQGNRPASKYVSDLLASQYQFISGIFMIVRDMIEKADPQAAKNNIVSAKTLYQYADEFGVFESINGMVCAGSPRKIMEFMDVLMRVDQPDEIKLAYGANTIHALTDDSDRWLQYAVLAVELDAVLTSEFFIRETARQPERAKHFRTVSEIYAQLGQYCVVHLGADGFSSAASFEDGILARQNAILELLGWPILKSIPEKVIAQRLS